MLLNILEPVILGNEHFNLLVEHKLQFFDPHPVSQDHDHRYVARQHLVESLVVASLKDFQVVLWGKEIGFCGEYCCGLVGQFVSL